MANPDHVAIGAANFAAAYSNPRFAEAYEAAAVKLRSSRAAAHFLAVVTPKTGPILTAAGIAWPLKPGSPAAESVLVMKKLRGEI